MRRAAVVLLGALLLGGCGGDALVVGSKAFTESVVLGEVLAGTLRDAGLDTRHERELGGTRIVFDALVAGEVDLYVEYTGTVTAEILADRDPASWAEAERLLAARGVVAGPRLGFENTYAVAMPRTTAEARGIETISDLAAHPDLRLGFSNEFMDREDGWPRLARTYGLPHQDVRGLEHQYAYRAIAAGQIDVTDAYSTDARIERMDLRVLADDRGAFPAYDAVVLHRADLGARHPEAVEALARLAGTLDARRMRALNARVELDGEAESMAASAFLDAALGIETEAHVEGAVERLLRRTLEHVLLVVVAMAGSVLLGVALGIAATRSGALGHVVTSAAGLLQTIPGLALLALMVPLLGIGEAPTIVALFVYGLFPIVLGTHAGLVSIPLPVRESARVLDLSAGDRLRLVELPLAMPAILTGIRTAAVIAVGTATIGGLIGAGGHGQTIMTGIRLADDALIVEGALASMALALAVHLALGWAERHLVSPGLRIRAAE